MLKNKKIKFKIYTLGCKVNQYDSAAISSLLIESGLSLSEKNLDLIIINSCSVTKIAITKAKRMIASLKRAKPSAKIVLIGCWPKVYKMKNIENTDLVSFSKKYSEIVSDIKSVFPKFFLEKNIIKNKKINCLNPIEDRSRYFIKIQDGCQQFCSYCVIPLARGPLKSRPEKELINEIKDALENGFEEIVLSGIHLGLYGQDFLNKKNNLYQLLLKLLKIEKLGRIRLSSIELNEISDDIIRLISTNEKMCRHLHIPLQSASDKVLKLMNRPYNKKYFIERLKKIRKENSGIAISTDVIVGFPGESDYDFQETYDFCKYLEFSKIHVFSFSAHEKAAAFHFPDKVDSLKIKQRSSRLRELSSVLEKKFKNATLKNNKNLKVLIESFNEKNIKLKSEYYFDIILDKEKFLKKFCDCRKVKKDLLLGKIIDYKI